jgi:hypothetical protein
MNWLVKDSFLEGEGIYRVRRAASHDPDIEEQYGLETVVTASERGARLIDTILPTSIVRARCFLQYYLAFWSHEPMDQINHAIRLLSALGEKTIGVVSVGIDGQVRSHRVPKSRTDPETVLRMQEMLSRITMHGTLETSR